MDEPEFDREKELEEVEILNSESSSRLRKWEDAVDRIPYTHIYDDSGYFNDDMMGALIGGYSDVGHRNEEGHPIFFGLLPGNRALLYPIVDCNCGREAECPAQKVTGRQEGTWSEIFLALVNIQKADIGIIPDPPK